MNKPSRSYPKSLREVVSKVVADSFARQGFASAELVTRWTDIVGAEIATHSQPIKIQWPRPVSAHPSPANRGGASSGPEPGTLVLRVEGPSAIEIQHFSNAICDRVNRFLGWRAIGRIVLRQAPLRHGEPKTTRRADPAAAARVAATLTEIADEELRDALARLGAAVKRG